MNWRPEYRHWRPDIARCLHVQPAPGGREERGGRRERREERGERREEGRGNIAQEGIVVHGPHSHLAVLALPVEHLDLFTVCGYSQEILTLPHKLHI